MKQKYGLMALEARRLKISRLMELNDPFEFLGVDLSDPEKRGALQITKRQLSEKNGLLCFCKSWHNPVLWGHYAENHKGLCLGFEIPDELPTPIGYVTSRPLWPKTVDETFVQRLLFTKFIHWSYEDEYRIYASLETEENGLFFVNFSQSLSLRQVIVGAESCLSRRDLSMSLGSLANDVYAFKARAAFRTFRIVRNRVESLWV